MPQRVLREDGRPASVIVDVADAVDADIVILGRRGKGGVAELLLGSVSHEVALQAPAAADLLITQGRAGEAS